MTTGRGIFGTLALLALLSGCGGREPVPMASADLSPGHAECRAEARQAPELRELARSYNATNIANQDRVARESAEIEARAFQDCLRRRGLASRGGGVEPVRRSSGIF
jgi:hypothetical protein